MHDLLRQSWDALSALVTDRTALKEWLEILQSLLTSIAILGAAGWALLRYRLFREGAKCLAISHETERVATLADGATVVRLRIRVHNVGKIKTFISEGSFRALILEPLGKALPDERTHGRELTYEELPERKLPRDEQFELEPGESWPISHDYVIPTNLMRLLFYTYITSHRIRRPQIQFWKGLKVTKVIGWHCESTFEVQGGAVRSGEQINRRTQFATSVGAPAGAGPLTDPVAQHALGAGGGSKTEERVESRKREDVVE